MITIQTPTNNNSNQPKPKSNPKPITNPINENKFGQVRIGVNQFAVGVLYFTATEFILKLFDAAILQGRRNRRLTRLYMVKWWGKRGSSAAKGGGE